MKRSIIEIDEKKCNGCALCIPGCPEGAIQLIDGKARLVSDLFCDGLGACIGDCPQGAINVIEREAEAYDEKKVMQNIVKKGANTIKAHLKHLKDHQQTEYVQQAIDYLKDAHIPVPDLDTAPPQTAHSSCPGQKMMNIKRDSNHESRPHDVPSQLQQWPIQLSLINPDAPYFNEADLLIAADCTAFSFGNFHNRFLKGKKLLVFCPKLDQNLDLYVEKLSRIFTKHTINSITIIRMVVPCCGGTSAIVQKALQKSGRRIFVREYTISLEGNIE